jgi:hypothetical protein
MNRIDHPDFAPLSPEAMLLLHGVKSHSLSVVEQTIHMFPRLKVSDFTVKGHSFWAYFQKEIFHAYRNNVHAFEPLPHEDRLEATELLVRSQTLAAHLIRVFGDPFTTGTYSDERARDLDEKHHLDFEEDLSYRVGVRDRTVEKKKYRSSRFNDPLTAPPPSVTSNPAWTTLFNNTGWDKSNFNNQLALHFLSLPHAKAHLDAWFESYHVHPIHVAITQANVDLVTAFLRIGVDPNLMVSTYRGDDRVDFPRSSLLSFVKDASVAELLLKAGADPAAAVSNDRPVNLFVHWRKSFGTDTSRTSDLQIKMPALQTMLAKHWDNPDAPIDQLIQSSGKGTGVEFKSLLAKAGQAVAFQGRKILTDDTPEPTAYAAFLALNFPTKKPQYTQAKLLTEMLKDKLHEPSPSGESWLFQALTFLKPHRSLKDDKSQMTTSFEALGKTLMASMAWRLTFPASLYAGGTRASPPAMADLNTVAKLMTHLFEPTQPQAQSHLVEGMTSKDYGWVGKAFEFSSLSWTGSLSSGSTLSAHFSELYHRHIPQHRDGIPRSEVELRMFGSLFQPYFHFQRQRMSQVVFGTAYDPHIEAQYPQTKNMDGTVNRMNESERQVFFRAHLTAQLSDDTLLKERLSGFSLIEQQAMSSYFFSRDASERSEFPPLGRYGDFEINSTTALALALLKTGALPALSSEQIQEKLNDIGSLAMRSMFESAFLEGRQRVRETHTTRRPSFDTAL